MFAAHTAPYDTLGPLSPFDGPDRLDSTPIGYTIVVDRTVEEAFDLFTLGVERWWPRHRWLNLSADAAIWLDLAIDGTLGSQEPGQGEAIWGKVIGITPNRDLSLQLFVDHDWQPLGHDYTTLDMIFRGEGDTRARVDLHHRDFHRLGPHAADVRQGLAAPNGWPLVMKSFANLAHMA